MKMMRTMSFLILVLLELIHSAGLNADKTFWNQFSIKNAPLRNFELGELKGLGITVVPSFKNNKTTAIVWETPTQMTGDLLWGLLDWVGEGADWLSVDLKAEISSELKKALTYGSHKPDANMVWVLRQANEIKAVAKLIDLSSGKQRLIVKSFSMPKAKYKTPKFIYQDPNYSFFNYSLVGSSMCLLQTKPQCGYVHLDDPNLRVKLDGTDISFEYHKPDAKKLLPFKGYNELSSTKQKQLVDDWRGFLRYEYTIMVRAFIHSTRGIFSWQDWQWLDNWEKNFISREEITSFLKVGEIPSSLTLVRFESGAKLIEMSCDLNGRYYMRVYTSK